MRVGFIGCDDTATVLARGWGERILCADADRVRAIGLAAQIGGDALMSYEAVARRAEIAHRRWSAAAWRASSTRST